MLCQEIYFLAYAQNVPLTRTFYLTKYLPKSTLLIPPSLPPMSKFPLIFLEEKWIILNLVIMILFLTVLGNFFVLQ